ncbi:MAG: T9SS type A sorting domain-containing protein [Flavobacteriales bacterium]|nr:T9SS type A sorting domain-containing protein [Flavobacteriales bacterium]
MWLRISVLSIIIGLVSASSAGQITLTADDMPSAGDMIPFTVSAVLPDGIDPSETGEAMVWDYSQLSPGINGVDTFYTVEETPFLYQFFFNNGLLYPDHQADHARKEMSVNLGLVNITNAFSYFKSDDEGYRNVGFGANVNGLPSSVRNIPIDWIYEFPLEYENESFSPSASQLEIPTLGYYEHEQERQVLVEGWGTLILPNQSYEVLKVKMVVNAIDSVYIESLGTGFPIVQPEETIYQWLALGEGEPLLQISQQVGFGYTVRYRYEDAVAIEELNDVNVRIYPNPASEVLLVNSSENRISRYAILDTKGNLFEEEYFDDFRSDLRISLNDLSSAAYVLIIEIDGSSYYSTFFKD